MKRTMYHNSAARIVYRSYTPEPVTVSRVLYARWHFIVAEASAAFVIGFILAVLL